jgi:hypothetical protein
MRPERGASYGVGFASTPIATALTLRLLTKKAHRES